MVTAINVVARAQNCRITRVEVVDRTGHRVTLAGERFRLVVGSRKMPSTWCNIRQEGPNFVFTDGHGLGHGVGMCQFGAEGMAQHGYTGMEILAHYYPNARFVHAYK
jgi:stage II sporulation protein D